MEVNRERMKEDDSGWHVDEKWMESGWRGMKVLKSSTC